MGHDEAVVGRGKNVDFEACPTRQPRARLDRLNGASAQLVLELVPFELDRPMRPINRDGQYGRGQRKTERADPSRRRMHPRAGHQRFGCRVEHQRVARREKPILTDLPAACAAEEPCSRTRTCPTSVSTT